MRVFRPGVERRISRRFRQMQKETAAVASVTVNPRLQTTLQREEEQNMKLAAFNAFCPFEIGDKVRDTAGREFITRRFG